MSNLDSVIEFCEERMEFKPFIAQINHRNTIVAKDPWGKYAGIFENNDSFAESMEAVLEKRRQQRGNS